MNRIIGTTGRSLKLEVMSHSSPRHGRMNDALPHTKLLVPFYKNTRLINTSLHFSMTLCGTCLMLPYLVLLHSKMSSTR